MGSKLEKGRREDGELWLKRKCWCLWDKISVKIKGEFLGGVSKHLQKEILGGGRKLSTAERCRGNTSLGTRGQASIKAEGGWEVPNDVAAARQGLFALELVLRMWFERPGERAERKANSRRGEARQHGIG